MTNIPKQYACLHLHSTHSDGVYTPRELAEIARDEGYGAIAVTDHDTVTANEPLLRECDKLGLECIYGVEFSTVSEKNNISYHMTAFHFDPEQSDMREYLRILSERETHQTRVLFDRGVEIGYLKNITWDEVEKYNEGVSWFCNEQVFRALKAKGLATDKDYPEFCQTCYGPHRSSVKPLHDFKSTEEVIRLVHNAGGIILMAHPFWKCREETLRDFDHFAELSIDGIEVWHPDHSAKYRRVALELALKHDLYVSGGADHSGLLGGQYARYIDPTKSRHFFPPCTLGTTKYFFEEIRDRVKKPDRDSVISALLSDDSIWQITGGLIDEDIL